MIRKRPGHFFRGRADIHEKTGRSIRYDAATSWAMRLFFLRSRGPYDLGNSPRFRYWKIPPPRRGTGGAGPGLLNSVDVPADGLGRDVEFAGQGFNGGETHLPDESEQLFPGVAGQAVHPRIRPVRPAAITLLKWFVSAVGNVIGGWFMLPRSIALNTYFFIIWNCFKSIFMLFS